MNTNMNNQTAQEPCDQAMQIKLAQIDVPETVLGFGKYRERTYSDICKEDPGYLYAMMKRFAWYDTDKDDKFHLRCEKIKQYLKENLYK